MAVFCDFDVSYIGDSIISEIMNNMADVFSPLEEFDFDIRKQYILEEYKKHTKSVTHIKPKKNRKFEYLKIKNRRNIFRVHGRGIKSE